ncbi:MAG: hypothetical protein ACRDST_10120 [Pseudonocardiaceae bacterium]
MRSSRVLDCGCGGTLRTPRDAGFADATQLWNGMITAKPALVVTAGGAADVVEAVGFAREHDLALSVRGGGHDIAGHRAGRRWPDHGHVRAGSDPGSCARSHINVLRANRLAGSVTPCRRV